MARSWRGNESRIAITSPPQSHHWPGRPESKHKEKASEVEVEIYDWDEEELDILRRCGLKYTIRSSKYPRTLKNPSRTLLILNNDHAFSVHTYLLTHFSTVLSKLIKSQPASSSPSSTPVHLTLPPVVSYSAFTLFLRWLYNPDKIPLQDYTPFRPPNISDQTLFEAALLASPALLGAAKFEKWLLRIIYYEIWFHLLPVSFLVELKPRLEELNPAINKLTSEPYYKATGLWWFSHAYLAWTDPSNAGNAGELDPYRWRVEHWYSICGRGGNWGCFHAMNTSGWGGVWERQRTNLEGIRRRGEVDRRMMGAVREIVGEAIDEEEVEGGSSGSEWEEDGVVERREMVVRPNAPSRTPSRGPSSALRAAEPPLARPLWSRIPVPRPPIGKHTVHANWSPSLRNSPPSSSDGSGELLWEE